METILGNLRARRRILTTVLTDAPGLTIARNNDPDGDCGSHLALRFASDSEAVAFIERHGNAVGLVRPLDSGRHVYRNWESVMERRARDPRCDPWKMAKREIVYNRQQCPKSLDYLGRTVLIQVPYERSLAEVEAIAGQLRG